MSPVYFREQGWSFLSELLRSEKAVILCDSNTRVCLEHLNGACRTTRNLPVIEIAAGEQNKKLKTCEQVWYELTELRADRKTILLNVGGGVVTDLGGFVANTFMRGIRFVHIPTSLLAMADAAVGGKTGIDFGNLKNMIGTFARPEAVLIDSSFLRTLQSRHYTNGLAEVLKHGFISDSSILDLMYANEDELISRSISVKMAVVKQDEFETGLRQRLNFGHTLGHAIESHFMDSGSPVLHGEAIAAGMIIEAFLSMRLAGLSESEYAKVRTVTDSIFKRIPLETSDRSVIKDLLIHDKKSQGGNTRFVLLKQIGEPIIDQRVSENQLDEALESYCQGQ